MRLQVHILLKTNQKNIIFANTEDELNSFGAKKKEECPLSTLKRTNSIFNTVRCPFTSEVVTLQQWIELVCCIKVKRKNKNI